MSTEQELKNLFQKYAENRCTAKEEKLLQEWFVRIGQESFATGLTKKDQQRMLHDFMQSHRFTSQKNKVKHYHLIRWQQVAVAAVLLGIIFFSWMIFADNSGKRFFYTGKGIALEQIETGSGQIKKVVLPDSSIIWLNACTKLAYHADFATYREIKLSGEAFFEVTYDPQRPFTVLTAGHLKTTVLGTQFNIRSYDRMHETQVTVLSGLVQVQQLNKLGLMGTLSSNQAIRFDREQNKYVKTGVNAASIIGWRVGRWELKNQGIEELALLLYNHYGVTVVNHCQELAALQVDANFTKQQNVREIITVFCLLAGCQYEWKGDTTVELY